eukprot:COSAG06_NODE_4882_length_3884_cov_18.362748_2_plen_42_part_00
MGVGSTISSSDGSDGGSVGGGGGVFGWVREGWSWLGDGRDR